VSKSTPSAFRGTEFWVYDVCKSLLLAQMVAVVEDSPSDERPSAIADIENDLRVDAAVGDLFLPLDEWADRDEGAFLSLVSLATDRLNAHQRVTAAEAADCVVLDAMPVIWRGDPIMAGARRGVRASRDRYGRTNVSTCARRPPVVFRLAGWRPDDRRERLSVGPRKAPSA
jgi:hypothetical protein